MARYRAIGSNINVARSDIATARNLGNSVSEDFPARPAFGVRIPLRIGETAKIN